MAEENSHIAPATQDVADNDPMFNIEPSNKSTQNQTVLDPKGNDSTELPDFLEEASKAEEARSRGEEPEFANKRKPKEPKKIEPKPREQPVEAKPVEEKPADAAPKDDEAVSPELMTVLSTDKPMTARRIKQFLKEIDGLKKTTAEKDGLIKQLQEKGATTPAGNEDLAKAREELNKTNSELLRYRRRYDLDNDPVVKEKFDEPIKAAEAGIADTLKRYEMDPNTMKTIADAGGLAEFSRSGRVFPVNEPDPAKPGDWVKVKRTAGELVKNWLDTIEKTNPADAEYIRSKMGSQLSTRDDKKRFIEKETAEAENYFKARDEESKKAAVQQQQNTEAVRAEYGKWCDSQIEKTDWLKDKEPPTGATAEQKKQIEEHNAFTKQLRTMLKNPPTDSKDKIMERLFEGVEAHHLRRENGAMKKELDAARAELSKLKGGQRTTPRSGSLLAKSSEPADRKGGKLQEYSESNFDKAISDFESGQGS